MERIKITPSGKYDADKDTIKNYIKNFVDPPEIHVYHESIGWYEYWGQKHFDRGGECVKLDNDGPYVFGVNLDGVDEDYLENISDCLIGEKLAYLDTIPDIGANIVLMITTIDIEGNTLLIRAEWKLIL